MYVTVSEYWFTLAGDTEVTLGYWGISTDRQMNGWTDRYTTQTHEHTHTRTHTHTPRYLTDTDTHTHTSIEKDIHIPTSS